MLNASCYASVPLAKTFTPGTTIGQHGKVVTCETEPGQIVRRHQEQVKMPLLLEGPKDPDVLQCGSSGCTGGESGSKDKSRSLVHNGACKSQLDGPPADGQPTSSSVPRVQMIYRQTVFRQGMMRVLTKNGWDKIKEPKPGSPLSQQWPRRSSRKTVPVRRFIYD